MNATVPHLLKGQCLAFQAHGFTFILKYLGRQVYHLRRTDITSRSRFGTYAEICEDIEYAKQAGGLRGGDKGRF